MGAEAGDVDAQYKLACFCERGVGVPADIHAAFALYTAAAAQDDPDAILADYHCPTCKRWWAYMTGLNITEITFGAQPDEGNDGEA